VYSGLSSSVSWYISSCLPEVSKFTVCMFSHTVTSKCPWSAVLYESGSQLSKCHVTKNVDNRNNFALKFQRLYTSVTNEHQGCRCMLKHEWIWKYVYWFKLFLCMESCNCYYENLTLVLYTYNGYRVSFPGVKRPGCGVDHPPSSSAGVKERVELYLYSPSGPSWPILGRTLPLPLTLVLS
jgi:hypothetical protein